MRASKGAIATAVMIPRRSLPFYVSEANSKRLRGYKGNHPLILNFLLLLFFTKKFGLKKHFNIFIIFTLLYLNDYKGVIKRIA